MANNMVSFVKIATISKYNTYQCIVNLADKSITSEPLIEYEVLWR